MIDANNRDQSYGYFIQEAPELLQTLEQELLNLEQECSIARIHTLMRVTHTLKGAAASVEIDSIRNIAHSLEDIFRALCRPDIIIDPETLALLFEGYECLRMCLAAEIADHHADAAVIDQAATVFTRLQQKLGDCFGQEAYLPTSSELGFDVIESIFEVGVAQRLEQIAQALTNALPPPELAEIVQTQAEVFLGLAESLNLPGFGAIATMTLAALDNYPEQVGEIAQAALSDFQQAQTAILTGDRISGGTPTALQQFAAAPEQTILAQDIISDVDAQIDSLDAIWNMIPEEPIKRQSLAKSPPPATVRVGIEHLERLNYLLGELLTNQNRQGLQNEQIQAEIQQLQSQLQHHRQIIAQLQDYSDRQQLISEYQSIVNQRSHFPTPDAHGAVDQVHRLVDSLRQTSTQLQTTADRLESMWQQSSQISDQQSLLFTQTFDDLLKARMMPLRDIFQRLPQIVQQLEALHDKPVTLKFSGGEVLLDKAVAEKLYDPLLHLVRNAFDHGIEPVKVRQQRGKVETGEITICAYHQGSHLMLEIKDDGQGLNFERIRQQAVAHNIVAPEQVDRLDQAQLMDLLFEPGFSTATHVDNLSGRGIGLDVVRTQLQALQGAITVYSEPNFGTTFLMQIPFSLTIAKLLVCQAGDRIYAFPLDTVEQILIPHADQIQQRHGITVLKLDTAKRPVLLCQMQQILHYHSPVTASLDSPLPQTPSISSVIILRYQDKLLGLQVEQVIEQELVIRPLESIIVPPSYVYGSSVLADGKLSLVFDSANFAKYVFDQQQSKTLYTNDTVSAIPTVPAPQISTLLLSAPKSATILLVDDSLTQRQDLAAILQQSGYYTLHASNGNEAVAHLQYADIQLVICDLEMPQMNGFEFLKYRQQNPQIAQIPVIILTASNEEKLRSIAVELGATAYMNKPYSANDILTKIANLLEN